MRLPMYESADDPDLAVSDTAIASKRRNRRMRRNREEASIDLDRSDLERVTQPNRNRFPLSSSFPALYIYIYIYIGMD